MAERFRSRDATVAMVGMGRVGLPLAIALAHSGLRVMGIDSDRERRDAIELGKMPFHEPGCDEAMLEVVTAGRLTVHPAPDEAVPHADAIILCVGTPLGGDLRADYGQLKVALRDVAPHLRSGQLVLLRSTVSPGTLEKVVARTLREDAPQAQGLLFAVCPERIAEGRAMEELRSLPEVVGAVDEASAEAAAALFSILGEGKRIHLTDPASAELAKLFTNVYRYVNFALANEFALLGEQYGVDAHRVVEMVNDDYPRAHVPRPGPAGGPCLSKDGYFLVEELTLPDFVLTAWKLNDTIPAHVVRRLADRLSAFGSRIEGTPIAVLGQTFKRDCDDVRQSPAARLTEILRREGAEVRTHDPFLPGSTLQQTLAGARVFVLATNHSHYDSLDPRAIASLMEPPRFGLDCWGVLDRTAYEAVGVSILAFGVGEAG